MSRSFLLFFCISTLGVAACSPGNERENEGARTPAVPAAEAFCEEHQIAEAQCPFCNPELIESLGWCHGHSVPEAFCYLCNPALIPAFQAVGDWCAGHDRPESQCYICNPELDPSRKGAALTEPTETLLAEPDSEDVPRSQRAPAVYCSTQNLVVQFESEHIARQAGLEFASVERRAITKAIECNARLTYDGDRHARLSSQVPGVVAEVHRDLGDAIEAGEPLVTITSAELGSAKAAYLHALAAVRLHERTHEREVDLRKKSAGTERAILEAEAALAESRIDVSRSEQELLRLGIPSSRFARIAEDGDTSPAYVLTAPFAGTVVERNAVLGEVVHPEDLLLAVADVSEMWALLEVYESDVLDVRTGQLVALHVEGLRGQAVPGTITWVASHVDPRTRTLQARVELENPYGILRANMFAEASIAVRDHHPALVVPIDAVQWEGCCNVAFVKRSEALYEPRKLLLGVSTGTVQEVLHGLQPNDVVVTQGSFLLKTELLKGSIGAGCCEVQPGT